MKHVAILFLMIFVFAISTNSFACDSSQTKRSNYAYFDTATGHKYVQINPSTYAQYARNGRLVKKVSNDFPRLKVTDKVYPITNNCYILYEKYSHGERLQKLLPGNSFHPGGWKAKKLLFSQNNI